MKRARGYKIKNKTPRRDEGDLRLTVSDQYFINEL